MFRSFSTEADRLRRGVEDVERRIATLALTDGAAVFFPDKEARRKQLFSMMSSSAASNPTDSMSDAKCELHTDFLTFVVLSFVRSPLPPPSHLLISSHLLIASYLLILLPPNVLFLQPPLPLCHVLLFFVVCPPPRANFTSGSLWPSFSSLCANSFPTSIPPDFSIFLLPQPRTVRQEHHPPPPTTKTLSKSLATAF